MSRSFTAISVRRPYSERTTPRSASTILGIEDRGVHHVGEQAQRGVERGPVGAGEVEHVDGLGRLGRRVGIAAEAGAEPLPGLANLAVAEIPRPPEGHMLDEMGPAPFLVLLVERARVDPQAHRHLTLRHGIAPDRVAQAVGQGAERPGRIGGDVGVLVEPAGVAGGRGGRGDEEEQGEEKTADHGIPSASPCETHGEGDHRRWWRGDLAPDLVVPARTSSRHARSPLHQASPGPPPHLAMGRQVGFHPT
jgi:hypothetical protein